MDGAIGVAAVAVLLHGSAVGGGLRSVLARARAIYLGEEDERWDDLADHLSPFADHLVREIRTA